MDSTHVRCALMRILRALVLAWLISAIAAAASGQPIVYVDDDAAPGGNGSSWGTAYNDLQLALDAAVVPGSGITEIRVGQGLYKPTWLANPNVPTSATFRLLNGVALVGGFAGTGSRNPDERDPEAYVSRLSEKLSGGLVASTLLTGIAVNSTAVIDGFMINGVTVNSNASPSILSCTFASTADGDGTMHNTFGSSPTITNCKFIDQPTGAMLVSSASNPVLTNCLFSGNHVSWMNTGGAIYFAPGSVVTLHACQFINNYTESAPGGAVDARFCSSADLQDCEFTGNASVGGGGAFLSTDGSGTLSVVRCRFRQNIMNSGVGALVIYGNSFVLRDCLFIDNEAFVGAGVLVKGVDSYVTNCVFIGNESLQPAAALNVLESSNVAVVNCTFFDNAGGGVHSEDSSGTGVKNCILWGNTPLQVSGNPTSVSFTDIQGGWSGAGSNNINVDPMFLQPGCDNLHLAYGSPCIDAGNNSYIPPGITTDLDGQARIQNGIVDMGAYEGGHDPLPPTACEDNLDQGWAVKLMPSGGAFNPPTTSAIFIENISAPDNAWVTVTQIDSAQHPGAGGFNELGSILDVQTSLPDSQFFMRVYIPFTPSNLNGFDPLDADLTYFDSQSGDWQLAALANTQNSPGHKGPIGDRIVTVGSSWNNVWTFELGDYGVFWNPSTQQGFVWANVDHASDFAFGIKLPQCSGDCAYPTNGFVNQDDLTSVINAWGITPTGPASFADINHDGLVNAADLLAVLNGWGPCP